MESVELLVFERGLKVLKVSTTLDSLPWTQHSTDDMGVAQWVFFSIFVGTGVAAHFVGKDIAVIFVGMEVGFIVALQVTSLTQLISRATLVLAP